MTEKTRSEAVAEVVDEHPDAVIDYHDEKDSAVNFLVGQTLIKLEGRGDPGKINQEVRDQLGETEKIEAIARRAFMKGYEKGHGVESIDEITTRTSERMFEQWWSVNFGDT